MSRYWQMSMEAIRRPLSEAELQELLDSIVVVGPDPRAIVISNGKEETMTELAHQPPRITMARKRTLGDKRVVRNFNPSVNSLVDHFKALGAALIDQIDALPNTNSQTGRWKSIAMTDIETGISNAVKAATAGQDTAMDEE